MGSEGDPGGGQGIQCRYPSRVWEKHLGCRAGKLFVRHLRDMAGGPVPAAAAGVDYILLPGDLPEDTVEKLQETLGTDTELETTAGYYLIEIG